MRDAECPITFRPSGDRAFVLTRTRLLEAAAGAGLVVDQPCGGEGTCGKCRVIVTGTTDQPSPAEQKVFSPEDLEAGWRLACQCSVEGPVEVEIPETSRIDGRAQVLVRGGEQDPVAADPAVRKQYVELPTPARGDDDADLVRLEKAIGPFEIPLALLRRLPGQLREQEFCGTVVLSGDRLIDFEPGDTSSEAVAVAVDIGTTTLAGVLLDLTDGQQRAVVARLNPQTRFGDDVLSRIVRARSGPERLRQLQEVIVRAVDEMIGELVAQADTSRDRVYEIICAGNTTMQQLLCGVDPGPLGEVPFVPAAGHGLTLPAAELGFDVHPRASAYLLPVIGGFVGGDAVAGVLATRLSEADGPTLLVDIGTNGEIVLAAHGRLTAASTAAGPAFEGARIGQGMRGCAGAIEKVVVDGQLHANVIGDVPPVGVCGSALIDTAAELLRHGVLASNGRLAMPDELPDGVPADLARRIVLHQDQSALLLAESDETGTGEAILLTQRDFRELQLATGAIRAGIRSLLQQAGIEASDLEAVYIGGGFGNFIRSSNAQRIGLMPQEVDRSRIRFQGNTSLAGARWIARSQSARQLAEELARRTEHVDLSCDPDFQTAFAEAMIFPEEVADAGREDLANHPH